MGTTYSVTYFSGQGTDHCKIQKQIHERLEELDMRFSNWKEGELHQINQNTPGQKISISEDMAVVLTEALRICRLSDGYFDPTIGELINLYGFGPKKPQKAPEEDEIRKAVSQSGCRNLILNSDQKTILKKSPFLLNLSAIAKGYAVDEAAALLEENAIYSYFVEIGGEVKTGAAKPDGRAWRTGIQKPEHNSFSDISEVLALNESAIATSGNYRNSIEKGGKTFVHIIDPVTGISRQGKILSATVTGPSCMTSDALATAAIVSNDIKKALGIIKSAGSYKGYLIYSTGNNEMNYAMTRDFPLQKAKSR